MFFFIVVCFSQTLKHNVLPLFLLCSFTCFDFHFNMKNPKNLDVGIPLEELSYDDSCIESVVVNPCASEHCLTCIDIKLVRWNLVLWESRCLSPLL